MTGKVFISCGQWPTELQLAERVSDWLRSKGYCPYVALKAQSLQDVDSGIISQLRASDYFLFIDFKRERIEGRTTHRGSLYAHQELALAYALGFQKCLFLQEEGVEREGMGAYIQVNPHVFRSLDDVPSMVKESVEQLEARGEWTPAYSRHLVPGPTGKSPMPYRYQDGVLFENGTLSIEVISWGVPLMNRRSDQPAFHAVGRCLRYADPQGNWHDSPDRSALKWGGARGYERTIFPESSDDLSVLSMDYNHPRSFYVHSTRDIHPRRPIIRDADGEYRLHYEVCAFGFPRLEFELRLMATGDAAKTDLALLT